MTRIGSTFARLKDEGKLGLIAYLTVGYPTISQTPELVKAIVTAGVDMVELGIPFSDPLADGRTIQASSQRALKGGTTAAGALDAARRCRELISVPLLFMPYLNPVLNFGTDRFCHEASAAGIDGLIIPDLPPQEAAELRADAARHGLDVAFFVAPTSTPARIAAACAAATGFVYCISLTGITGGRDKLNPEVAPLVRAVRNHTPLPVAVGFGLSRREHLEMLEGVADGAIVGSALLEAIEKSPEAPGEAATRFVRELRPKVAEPPPLPSPQGRGQPKTH